MLTIRPELPEDYPTVFEIHHRAFGRPDEAFMVIELEPRALRGRSGTVNYLPEFSAV